MAQGTRRTIAIIAGFALGAGLAGVACVIADPPAEIPVPPLTAPEILHDLVTPSATILQTWPLEFVIPIAVQDPGSSVQWRAFLDYDPYLRQNPFTTGELDPDPAGEDGGVRVLAQHFQAPTDMNTCHTVEVVVALSFALANHTPDPPGGDSITWIYTPTGSITDCPVYDAGPFDASVDSSGGAGVDGGDEASDGAVE